jgi:hypothetical protein
MNGTTTDEVVDVIDVNDTVEFIETDATVCPIETVYVPVPPDPVPNAVIVVYCVTPVPEITCPTANVPLATAETVIVAPEIEAVNDAELEKLGGLGLVAAGVPGQFLAPKFCCCSSMDHIPAATVVVGLFKGPIRPPLPLRIRK